jgi:hypothetical protein
VQRLHQFLDVVCDGLEHLNITALHAGDFAGFARVKMVLAVLALKHFSGSSDFESLCDCFLSLHTNSYSARRFGGWYRKFRSTLRLCNDCCQLSALSLDRLLDFKGDISLKHGDELADVVFGQVGMGFFATTHDNFHFYLIALIEKALCLLFANAHVVLTNASREANTFDFHALLLCLLALLLFVLFVLVFTEIDNTSDWRVNFGLNNHEIELCGTCFHERFWGWGWANMDTIFVDKTNKRGADVFVDLIHHLLWLWFKFSA